jgi:cytochrome c oxidase cbb3-type subunit IV
MSAGFINGIVTALLLVLFIGLVLWAWSGKRKADFERAARLPLEDHKQPPQDKQPADATDHNGTSS